MKFDNIESLIDNLQARYPAEDEYLQAVRETFSDLEQDVMDNEKASKLNILGRLAEPDRIISFRVNWVDDRGFVNVNRGWRVQHCNLIGPYKGGLRFHPTVNESVLKFLAFEQTFKNALTGLSIGGAKGGADFDPRGRSDDEIMRFCQAFMDELYRYIGDDTDVPAGDINVGSREIGFLFGRYRKLVNSFSGSLTGKNIEFGGSHVRLESTGFGLIYFVEQMLSRCESDMEDKVVAVSGAGNVALHAALKAIELGAKVITLSSSKGFVLSEDGLTKEQISDLLESKAETTEKLKELKGAAWHDEKKPWTVACDIALPCATQNELDEDDAKELVKNKCWLVAEGANMPCTDKALKYFEKHEVLHAPGKASNAGGVALSALEMGQNKVHARREFDDLDEELRTIMKSIHDQCIEHAGESTEKFVNYRFGANRSAFKQISSAMRSQGI